MDYGDVLIAEAIIMAGLLVHYVIQRSKLINSGRPLVNRRFENIGLALGIIAFALLFSFTKYVGQPAIGNDRELQLPYLLVSILSVGIFYLGLRFRLSAYELPQNLSFSVKSVCGLIRALWRDALD